jgi:hypothetical protein
MNSSILGLTHSLSVLVGVAELLAQPFLVLYCHFSVSFSNLAYYEYTTKLVPIYVSKALVMLQSVIFSVTHSRVKEKTTSFH